MKSCKGCKYLFIYHGKTSWCQEPADVPSVYRHDPLTGKSWYESGPMKYGLNWTNNTTEKCRSEGMPCGPDAKLWSPNLWQRMFGPGKPQEV